MEPGSIFAQGYSVCQYLCVTPGDGVIEQNNLLGMCQWLLLEKKEVVQSSLSTQALRHSSHSSSASS